MKVHERIAAALSRLGISRGHFAASLATELEPLFASKPWLAESLTLVNPNRLTTQELGRLGDRLQLITGSEGLPAETVAKAMPDLPLAKLLRFDGYRTAAWSDMVADQADAISAVLEAQSGLAASIAYQGPSEGEIAGITYRIEGKGPVLVLLPLLLAPSQWDPIAERLSRRFTVVRLGGAHLGMMAMLESRGQEPGYQRAVRSVFDEVAPSAGETILEIGCGSGVLARWLAAHTDNANPVIATDRNPFFLREAAALAESADLGGIIEFREANAEALPFADDSIDIAFSSTVMEECDADKMLGEMIRVTRPGGRVAVIVRAIDAHSICSVDTDPEIKAIIEAPYRSVGEHGCADASLYRRFRCSELERCQFFPHLLTLRDPNGAAWAYREPFFLAQLSPAQRERWRAAMQVAADADQFVFASALHCAVGTKTAVS